MNKYKVKEAIGEYCEGCEVSEGDLELIKKALSGFVETDQGNERYYVELDSICLDNIDIEEAIWSLNEHGTYKGDENDMIFFDEIFDDIIISDKISKSDNPDLKRGCLYGKIINPLKKFNKE